MSDSFIDVDSVREQDLPGHLQDGKSGDRVSFLEGGLLHVRDRRASFVRWSDVLGVVEHHGTVHVLVPRRPPASPWLEVESSMVGGGRDALRAFVQRVEGRGSNSTVGGYRDAVRQRRQNLGPEQLLKKVVARETVPGALEVPSTIMLGVSYPGLAFAQLCILGVGMVLGYIGMLLPMLNARRADESLVMFAGYGIFMGCLLGAAWAAVAVGRYWREAKNRTLPRQRVLVLTPDGCIIGFRTGVRTLAWSEVQSFGIGADPETFEDALVVMGADGRMLGDVQAAWLDAPLGLVVRVAQAYREAALD